MQVPPVAPSGPAVEISKKQEVHDATELQSNLFSVFVLDRYQVQIGVERLGFLSGWFLGPGTGTISSACGGRRAGPLTERANHR